jgi:hypothetical protein
MRLVATSPDTELDRQLRTTMYDSKDQVEATHLQQIHGTRFMQCTSMTIGSRTSFSS